MRLRALWFVLLSPLLFWANAAQADVKITFYSHELGEYFPHAFVRLEGTDYTGKEVDSAFGFTSENVSPAMLFGWVKGEVVTSDEKYVARSTPQFSMLLTDDEYRQVLLLTDKWRKPGKTYHMNKRNCVHFVAAVAQLLGLKVNADSEYYKKPRSFLQEVMALNPGVSRGATLSAGTK